MRICVVGAGSSGLTAIKACREAGLEVDCFEAAADFGGLWRYHDEDQEGRPSVMRSTVINTSKEMSAFSDFPPPKDFANFMHHSAMLEYFRLYAERFDLLKHIRYSSKVVKVEKADDYDTSGRWRVQVQDLESGATFAELYDGVMVCSGHHVFPNVPEFQGLDRFRGRVLHTHSLKTERGFEGRTALVVGIGNSGVDAATELCKVTKKVYLSTRRGSWILPRRVFGMPLDFYATNRISAFLNGWNPFHLMDTVTELFINLETDHTKYRLKPRHRFLEAHPTVSDSLPHCISTGQVALKPNVRRFCHDGVVFEGESKVTEIDDVVLATGYQIKFPFLSEDILKVRKNSMDLYKLVFPAHLPHPSLALIGCIQPRGCIFPIAEAQSRWFAHLMRGRGQLPPPPKMMAEVKERQHRLSKGFVNSPRHTIQVEVVPYMDEICQEFGARPNLMSMFFKDPRLFLACMTQGCVSYQYRLQGPHKWEGARRAILSLQERVDYPFQTCLPFDQQHKERNE